MDIDFVNRFPGTKRKSTLALRVFDLEEHVDLFLFDGYVRMNTIGKLRNEFSEKGGGIHDTHEGAIGYIAGDLELEFDGETHVIKKEEMQSLAVSDPEVDKHSVYCFYAPSLVYGEEVWIEEEEFLDKVIPCDEMTDGGRREWGVAITRMDELIERLRQKVKEKGGSLRWGFVRYVDPNEGAWPPREEDIGLLKRDFYSFQNEFRFIVAGIDANDEGLLEFWLGDLSDVAVKCHMSKLRGNLGITVADGGEA